MTDELPQQLKRLEEKVDLLLMDRNVALLLQFPEWETMEDEVLATRLGVTVEEEKVIKRKAQIVRGPDDAPEI